MEVITVSHSLFKIGVSKKPSRRAACLLNPDLVPKRLIKPSQCDGKLLKGIRVKKTITCNSYAQAYNLERELHSRHTHAKYSGVPILPNGNSELFLPNSLITLDFMRLDKL
jgi:hypothetical protein